MATVTAVYFIEPDVRDAESVIAGLRRIKPVKPEVRPRPQNKRVWASLKRSLPVMITEMFDEAQRLDPKRERPWLALVDGGRKLDAAIRREARKRGVEVTLVLDAIHALQYLWKAGHKRTRRARRSSNGGCSNASSAFSKATPVTSPLACDAARPSEGWTMSMDS